MVLKQYVSPDMANAHAKQIISSQYKYYHVVVTPLRGLGCHHWYTAYRLLLDKSFPWNALPIEGEEEGLEL